MSLTVPNSSKVNIFRTNTIPVGIMILALLYFVIPSLNNGNLEQSTLVTKTIYFTYGLGIASVLCVLGHLFNKNRTIHLKISKLDLMLLVFAAFVLVNRYIVQDNYGFSLRFIDFVGLAIVYIILRLFDKRYFILLGIIIILSGVIQAIYGILQLSGHTSSLHSAFNISGSYFNPGPYAGFLATVWTISLGMYLFKENIISTVRFGSILENTIRVKILRTFFEYVPLTGIVFLAIVLPATRSRAAWIALIAGSVPLLLIRYNIFKWVGSLRVVKRFAIFFMCTLTFAAAVFGLYHFKKASADGRVLIWKVSTSIIKDYPFFGVGFDRFSVHYMNAQAEYFSNGQNLIEGNVADNSYYAFNEPIQLTVENGFLGLAIAIFIAYSIIKIKVGTKKHFLKILCLSVLLTVTVFGLFSYPSQILPIKMIVVFIIAFIATLDKGKIFFNIDCPKWGSFQRRLSNAIIIVTVATATWKIYPFIEKIENGYQKWKTAMNTYGYGRYSNSLTEFENALPVLRKNGDFLMNYGKALVMAGKNQEAITVLNNAKNNLNTTIIETALGDAHKSLGNYKNADRAYRHAADMVPHRFYPHYLMAMLYMESGQVKKAKQKAQEILKKEVKVPSTAIDEIQKKMAEILENPLEFDVNKTTNTMYNSQN